MQTQFFPAVKTPQKWCNGFIKQKETRTVSSEKTDKLGKLVFSEKKTSGLEINILPAEIWHKILASLTRSDLVSLRLTCKILKSYAEAKDLPGNDPFNHYEKEAKLIEQISPFITAVHNYPELFEPDIFDKKRMDELECTNHHYDYMGTVTLLFNDDIDVMGYSTLTTKAVYNTSEGYKILPERNANLISCDLVIPVIRRGEICINLPTEIDDSIKNKLVKFLYAMQRLKFGAQIIAEHENLQCKRLPHLDNSKRSYWEKVLMDGRAKEAWEASNQLKFRIKEQGNFLFIIKA